eukprot:1150742-Pelagomonas_calceolata.AAC.3
MCELWFWAVSALVRAKGYISPAGWYAGLQTHKRAGPGPAGVEGSNGKVMRLWKANSPGARVSTIHALPGETRRPLELLHYLLLSTPSLCQHVEACV